MKKYIITLAIIAINCQFSKAQYWELDGNASTDPCNEFIGTTDSKILCIKTNSTTRIKITSGGDVAIGNYTPAYKLDVNGDINFNTDAFSLRMGGTAILKADNSDGSVFGGQDAGNSITLGSGLRNTAFGYEALYSTTGTTENTAVGHKSLRANTGYGNTGLGHYALISHTSGDGNTAVGDQSLVYDTTQNYNTGVGFFAGYYQSSSTSTFVGAYCYANANGYSNCSGFGYGAPVSASNQVRLGNTSVTQICGFVDFTTCSDGRFKRNIQNNVPGLSFINKLNPVTYNYDIRSLEHFLRPEGPLEDKYEKDKIVYTGFVAQEVEIAAKELNYNFSGVDKPQNEKDIYGLRYAEFVVPIVKSIQELDASIKEKDAQIAAQQMQIDKLKSVHDATLTGSNQIRLGNPSVTSIYGQVGFTTFSDGRFKNDVTENVPGLAFINKLRPVTYHTDIRGIMNFLKPAFKQEKVDGMQKILYSGFIAQEVENSAKELNYDFSGVDKPQNENDLYGLRYGEFVVPVVKAIQELDVASKEKDVRIASQQVQIDELKTMVATLIESDSRNAQEGVENSSVGLKQNQPNPFSEKTVINYTLPADASQAMITVYSINGKEIANYAANANTGSIEISAKTLSPGNYIYKLIVSGKIVDSKIMTITR